MKLEDLERGKLYAKRTEETDSNFRVGHSNDFRVGLMKSFICLYSFIIQHKNSLSCSPNFLRLFSHLLPYIYRTNMTVKWFLPFKKEIVKL